MKMPNANASESKKRAYEAELMRRHNSPNWKENERRRITKEVVLELLRNNIIAGIVIFGAIALLHINFNN